MIAVRKGTGDEGFVFNPVADTRLDPGDEVILLGEEDQIDELREYLYG